MTVRLLAAAVLLVAACEKDRGTPETAAPAKPGAVATPPAPVVMPTGPSVEHVKGPDYEGIIVVYKPGGPRPTPQEIAELETVLGPAIAAHELGQARPASAFKREYRGGGATISVHLACDVDADWTTKPMPEVRGGGTCYGDAEYDVAARRITRLRANSRR